MNTLEMDAYKAELAREILLTDNWNLLDKVKRLISREAKKREAALKEQEGEMTKEEILSDFAQACRELKLHKEGKLEFKTLEEALDGM